MGCSSGLGKCSPGLENYFDDEAAGRPSAADDQDLDPGPARRNFGQGTPVAPGRRCEAWTPTSRQPHRASQYRRTAAHPLRTAGGWTAVASQAPVHAVR